MKLVLGVLFISCLAWSQTLTSKGSISLGGEIAYSETKINANSTHVLQLSPQASYFVGQNLELGLALAYTSSRQSVYSTSNTGVGPFLVRYMSDNNIKPFIGFSYLLVVNNQKAVFSDFNYREEKNAFSFMAGFLFPLNEKFAVQPVLQYTLYTGYGIRSLGDLTQILFGVGFKGFL